MSTAQAPAPQGPSFATRGVVVSVVSSVLFAGMYFVTPMLAPAPAEALWGLRILVGVPFIVTTLVVLRQWHLAADVWRRVRRRPAMLLGLVVCGALVSVQLWLFGWAPLNGRGLQVALGYFLLPLVLVLVGRLLYRDRLAWWQWAACGVAAVGVGYETIRLGGVSWETLVVALGYPAYFVLRRSMGTAHLGGMLWEFCAMIPLAAVAVGVELATGTAVAENPSLVWFGPLFGVWSALALVLYLLASRLLTISLFGLLSYVEPALLVVASMLNGERIASDEWITYLAIWAAVLVLVVGGAAALRRPRG